MRIRGPSTAPGVPAPITACRRAPFAAEVIPGAGHFVHLEAPDVVVDRVLAWLARN